MDALVTSFEAAWTAFIIWVPRLVTAIVVFGVVLLAGRMVAAAAMRVLDGARLAATHRTFFRRLIVWAFCLLGLVPVLGILGLERVAAGLLAGGGVTAIVLGFAFRGIGENLLAGLFLAVSRPFDVGDLVESGSFRGEVRSIDLRCTHIRTADGRDVFVPNAMIFNEPLVNFTVDGLRRLAFAIGVDYAHDADEVRATLRAAVEAGEHVLTDPPALVSVSGLLAQYQEIEVAFWVDVFGQGVRLAEVRSAAMERCRRALKAAGVTISADVSAAVRVGIDDAVDVRMRAPDRSA